MKRLPITDDDRLNPPQAVMIIAGFMLLWAAIIMAIEAVSG
jgi:hypothetical protein